MRLSARGALLVYLLGGSLYCAPGTTDSGSEGVTGASGDDEIAMGYILFSPLLSTTTYLVDKQGRVVHTWESEFAPGVSVYLLDNGHLLRSGRQPGVPFRGGGQGGRLQEYGWDGELVWDWIVASEQALQHHDIEPLSNGNVLAIVWDSKTAEEAIQAGRSSGSGISGII